MSALEMQLAAVRASNIQGQVTSPTTKTKSVELQRDRPKVFFVMGIITAFSSRKRRDSIRETWMPLGLSQLVALTVHKSFILYWSETFRNFIINPIS